MEFPLVSSMEMRLEDPFLKLGATILVGGVALSLAGLVFLVLLTALF